MDNIVVLSPELIRLVDYNMLLFFRTFDQKGTALANHRSSRFLAEKSTGRARQIDGRHCDRSTKEREVDRDS